MAGTTSSFVIVFSPVPRNKVDPVLKPNFRFSPRAESEEASSRRRSPSVTDVERAIGAGKFRDRDFSSKRELSRFIDIVQSSPILSKESDVERRLREIGEWLVEKTEKEGRAGQEVLMLFALKILPLWIFALLVASGIVTLPFSIPFLDDYLKV